MMAATMGLLLRATTLFLLTGHAGAAPFQSFPINSQVPPVARIAKPFSFTFSPSTFSSAFAITYSLAKGPRWLLLDGNARRLYGVPTEQDVSPGEVVGVPVELVATDWTGSATMTATLVVSRLPAPDVQILAMEQVPSFGPFSSPASVLSYPDKEFSFSFSNETFSRPGLNHYATTGDNTPLPSWISFDSRQLIFSGKTPSVNSLIQPPQTFDFQLVASDVQGFSAASLSFSVVVGIHQLTSDTPRLALNATVGSLLSDASLRGRLKIDGRVAAPEDLVNASMPNMPPWLAFDSKSWEFRGIPTVDARSTSFPLILKDTHGDTLNLTVDVNIAASIFRDSFRDVTIMAGSRFQVDLKPHLWTFSDVQVTVTSEPTSDWIRYDDLSKTLSGEVPVAAGGSQVNVTLGATLYSSGVTDGRTLKFRILESVTIQPSPTAAATPGDVPNDAISPTASAPAGDDPKRALPLNVLLPAVLLPILILCIVLLAVFICCCRRKREESRRRLNKCISGPVPGSLMFIGAADANSSLQELNKHYDVGHSTPVKSSRGREEVRGFGPAASGMQEQPPRPQNASTPTPVPSKSGSGGLPSNAWSSAKATLFAAEKTRRARSKSYLSDTSLFDESRNNEDPFTLPPVPVATGRSFRSDLEVDVPSLSDPDSIQQTPEFAYHGQAPSRSTGARHPQDDTRSRDEPARPQPVVRPRSWIRLHAVGLGDRCGSSVFGIERQNTSTATEQAGGSEHKTSFETADKLEEKTSRGGMLNRPRPSTLSVRQPPSLPINRRGQGSDGMNSFRSFSRFKDLAHYKNGPEQRDSNGSALSRESGADTASGVGDFEYGAGAIHPGGAGADPLGILHQGPGPALPPSKSWSTVPSSEGTIDTASLVQISSLKAPNWTLALTKEAEESPVINEWVTGARTTSPNSPSPPPLPIKDLKRASRYSVLKGEDDGPARRDVPQASGAALVGFPATTGEQGLASKTASPGSRREDSEGDYAVFI